MVGTILVIMPVGSDPQYRRKQEAIIKGISAAGLKSEFPVYEPKDPRFSAHDFADRLRAADGVLVDLTGERPSCYFELGFAEALGRPIFIVAERGTLIHQSAHRSEVRFYSDIVELERSISESLAQHA